MKKERSRNFWHPIEVAFRADTVTILPGIGHQTSTPDIASHPIETQHKLPHI